MGKKKNRRGNNRDERASFIVDMFREFPDNKFSLKHLAAASGGADRDGRTMTFAIVRQLVEDGFVEEVARSKYRLSRSAMPRYAGVVTSITPSALYVAVEALESDVFVSRRNGFGPHSAPGNPPTPPAVWQSLQQYARQHYAPLNAVAAYAQSNPDCRGPALNTT